MRRGDDFCLLRDGIIQLVGEVLVVSPLLGRDTIFRCVLKALDVLGAIVFEQLQFSVGVLFGGDQFTQFSGCRFGTAVHELHHCLEWE